MVDTLYWLMSKENSLEEAYNKNKINELFRTHYKGKKKTWCASIGWFFGRLPLYFVIEEERKFAGLHYVSTDFFYTTTSQKREHDEHTVAYGFRRLLENLSMNKNSFFESLNEIKLAEKDNEILNGLVKLLNESKEELFDLKRKKLIEKRLFGA